MKRTATLLSLLFCFHHFTHAQSDTIDPQGYIEQADCGIISGYGWDPDTAELSIDAHIYIDGNMAGVAKTTYLKQAHNFPEAKTGHHNFIWPVPEQYKDSATHLVEVYLINYPSGTGNNTKIGSQTIGPCYDGDPIGYIEHSGCNNISGWAFDPDDSTVNTAIHVYVDGNMETSFNADVQKDYVNTDFGIPGAHGFDYYIPQKFKDGNAHLFEVYMLNYPYGTGKNNPKLLHQSIGPCNTNDPFGQIDTVACDYLVGWLVDLDTASGNVNFHVFIDGKLQNPGYCNKVRADINSLYNVTGNHGFEWPIPGDYMDGNEHTISLYALNVNGTPGSNPQIGEQKFKCTPNGIRWLNQTDQVFLGAYPNPADELLNILITNQEKDRTRISLIDLLGRETVLYDQALLGSTQLQVNTKDLQLSPGTYFIRMISGDQLKTQKVILK